MAAERMGTAPVCRGSLSLSDAVYEMSPGAMNWVLEFPEARCGLLETYGGDSGIPMVGSLMLRLVDADRADMLEALCRYAYIRQPQPLINPLDYVGMPKAFSHILRIHQIAEHAQGFGQAGTCGAHLLKVPPDHAE